MKLIIAAYLVCYGCISMPQSNSSEFKIESFILLSGKEELYQGNQQFSNFSNTVDNTTFFPQNDTAYITYYQNGGYQFRTYTGEASFRKEDSKWRFILGATWNQHTNRSYTAHKTTDYIVDTVYGPVPYIFTNSDEEFLYSISYDTLYLDSISRDEWLMESNTKNIYVSAQILHDFKKNKYTFSTGVGLGMGISIKNEIHYAYNQYWGLQMARYWDAEYVQDLWYADIPTYNPSPGTNNIGALTRTHSESSTEKGNMQFMVRPYIPLRVEAQIAEQGFFSKVGVVGSFNAGAELQLIKNDIPRARLFWNYHAGLFFKL